jgi:hypothetical protein
MRLARRNFANSTLDNPVFAVMELHRFEVYINDGCEDAEIELGGPAEKFDNVFNSDYLFTPKAGPEDSLQRIASTEVFNADRPGNFRPARGGGGRGYQGGGAGRGNRR